MTSLAVVNVTFGMSLLCFVFWHMGPSTALTQNEGTMQSHLCSYPDCPDLTFVS
jgi:hypothetical protein